MAWDFLSPRRRSACGFTPGLRYRVRHRGRLIVARGFDSGESTLTIIWRQHTALPVSKNNRANSLQVELLFPELPVLPVPCEQHGYKDRELNQSLRPDPYGAAVSKTIRSLVEQEDRYVQQDGDSENPSERVPLVGEGRLASKYLSH